MSNAHRRPISARHRRGAMLVLIAICLPLLIIMAAFAVDVAWMQLARTELRTATDSAARAGAKELSLKQDANAARTKAQGRRRSELVAGEPLVLADADIEVGKSAQVGTGRFNFTPGGAKPNAVRVNGKRTDGSKSGPVDLMFAGVLGVDKFQPSESRDLDAARPRHLPGGRSLGFDDVDAHRRLDLSEGNQGMRRAASDAEPLGCAGDVGRRVPDGA